MSPEIRNLFATSQTSQTEEIITTLLQTPHLQLERIVSYGTPSESGFWYDQDKSEWVLLARGEAMLEYITGEVVSLKAGDFLLIPAHQEHRVRSCSQDALWLALFFDSP